jgi:pimeloyl-ACP methyl ester carboxylesterase
MTEPTLFALAAATLLVAAIAVEFLLPSVAARGWVWLARELAGLREHRIAVGTQTVPFLYGGRGEPLVLVHGFGGDKDNFSRIARFLSPHLRLIVPDLAGFGASARDAGGDYRVSTQVERLRAFVRALGLGSVHLGGNSMGGFIVAEYAARYPDEVASLWLLDPAGTAVALDTPMVREYARTGEIPLLVREPAAYSDLLTAVLERPVFIPRSLRRALAARAAADFPLHAHIFRQVRLESPLLEPLLPSISAATLIVWGAADRVLNPAAAALLQRAIAGSEAETMAGVGHLPMVERPRACARRYLEFRARGAVPDSR